MYADLDGTTLLPEGDNQESETQITLIVSLSDDEALYGICSLRLDVAHRPYASASLLVPHLVSDSESVQFTYVHGLE